MLALDQLEALRSALLGAVKQDYLNIVDAEEPIDFEEYGVTFGDVQRRLRDGDQEGILEDFKQWSEGAYSASDVERRVDALNHFKSLTFGASGFVGFQASWRSCMGKLSRAKVHKDATELYTRYLELLPDQCSSHVALHPSGPESHQDAARIAKKWFEARAIVKATSDHASRAEESMRRAEEARRNEEAPQPETEEGTQAADQPSVPFYDEMQVAQMAQFGDLAMSEEVMYSSDPASRQLRPGGAAAKSGSARPCKHCVTGFGHRDARCPSLIRTAEDRAKLRELA